MTSAASAAAPPPDPLDDALPIIPDEAIPAALTFDPRNANLGTPRGKALLADSLRQFGAGRSILADRNGVIVAGNKTLAAAADLGLPVRIVETDGSELVVVKRTDLDLDSKEGRSLAYADNRVAQLDLAWDPDQLLADQADGLDLAALGFADDELAALLGQEPPPFDAAAEWGGMPEYEHDDLQPVKQLVVSFAHADDLERFGQLIDQHLTMATRSIWFPPAPIGRMMDKAFVADGGAADE